MPGEHTICIHSNSTKWSLMASEKMVRPKRSVLLSYLIYRKSISNFMLVQRQITKRLHPRKNWQSCNWEYDNWWTKSLKFKKNKIINDFVRNDFVRLLSKFFIFTTRAPNPDRTQTKSNFRSTNSRVLWWSILQTLVLIGAAIWQVRHMRTFFEAKKLV